MVQKFNRTIQFLLILSTLTYMRGQGLDTFDFISFQIMAIITISFIFINNVKKNMALLYLFIPVIISTALTGFNNIVVHNTINFSLGLFTIYILTNFNKKYIYIAVQWSILLNLIVLVFQTIGFSPIVVSIGESGGLFGNAPRLCMYLAITLPFMFEKNKVVALFIGIVGVVLEEIYLPVFYIILLFKNKPIYLIGLVFLIASQYGKIFHSFTIRLPIWKPTIEQIFSSPVYGYGLGIFPHVSPQFVINRYWHADTAMSSLLQFIFSTGCIGVAGLVLFIKQLKFKWHDTDISLLFLCLLSLVEYPFEVPKLWFIICVIIGIKLGESYDKNKHFCKCH